MNRHLTERELVEHLFALTSEAAAAQAAKHLEACSACREQAERLAAKFATLDLLREDEVHVSDELIVRATATAAAPVKPRVLPLRVPGWAATAAAVFVVGALLLFAQNLGRRPARPIGSDPHGTASPESRPREGEAQPYGAQTPSVRSESGSHQADSDYARLRDLQGKSAPTEGPGEPAGDEGDRLTSGAGSVAPWAELGIPEKPPFAPASAIELVVLPRRENVQLTIYNSADLTLVRETRNLMLKRGWNWLQFMWANTLIDPTSLTLEPKLHPDKVDVRQLVFPPRLSELGRWLIRSEVGAQVPFELTYLTSGLSWRAFYIGTLSADEKTMRLDGYVRVDNRSGEEYEDAQTRLIVGKVHMLDQVAELAKRKYAYGAPVSVTTFRGGKLGRGFGNEVQWGTDGEGRLGGRDLYRWFDYSESDMGGMGGLGRKQIKKEGLSEYFLYTIEGTETIADQWGKRLLSFDADEIDVKNLYKYDEERYGQNTVRFLSFTNDEEHNLGETPIPDGVVRIYGLAEADGGLSYVGGASIKYVPIDEEIELNLGPARLVKVEPMLMDFATGNYEFDTRGNIAGWDETRTWQMKLTNTRTLPIDVEITRIFPTAYWGIEIDAPSVAYKKHDATHARFELTVPPRREEAFDYTVTTHHGTREETFRRQEISR